MRWGAIVVIACAGCGGARATAGASPPAAPAGWYCFGYHDKYDDAAVHYSDCERDPDRCARVAANLQMLDTTEACQPQPLAYCLSSATAGTTCAASPADCQAYLDNDQSHGVAATGCSETP